MDNYLGRETYVEVSPEVAITGQRGLRTTDKPIIDYPEQGGCFKVAN